MQVAARVCCDWLGMKEEAAAPRNSQVIQVTRCRVKAVCPGSKVIMTTACADPDIVQEALVAGADGYWVKPFSRTKCRAAIQFAMADGFALGNHVKPAMLRGMAPRPDSTTTLPGLSPRQSQILPLLRQGMCDKEIASQLRISEQTVGGYLKDLYRKLGARNRCEALLAWSSREEHL